MNLGPVLYQTLRPRRRIRPRTAVLLLVLLLVGVTAVALRPWAAPHHPSSTRRLSVTAQARSGPTQRPGPSPTTAGGHTAACPPPHRPGEPVGGDSAGHSTPPAAVRHSPWVRYQLPAAGPPAKAVALTFDDGPDPRFTPQVLAILARAHVPATFFMLGSQAAAHPDLVRRVARAGDGVGGHTWTHARLDRLPPARVAAELDCTDQLLTRLTGQPVHAVRPPDGAYDTTVVSLLAARGVELVLWTVDSHDWARPGVPRIVATVARELRPGAIVLFHDGGGDRSQTVAALPQVLKLLKTRGYRAVPLPARSSSRS